MATPKLNKPQPSVPGQPASVPAPAVEISKAPVQTAFEFAQGVNKGFETAKDFQNMFYTLAQNRQKLAEEDLSWKYQNATAETINQMRYEGFDFPDAESVLKRINDNFYGKVKDSYSEDFIKKWRQGSRGAKTMAISNTEAAGQYAKQQHEYIYQAAELESNNYLTRAFVSRNRGVLEKDLPSWLDTNSALTAKEKEKITYDSLRKYDLGEVEYLTQIKPALLKRELEKTITSIVENDKLTYKQKQKAIEKASIAAENKLINYAEKTEKQLKTDDTFLPTLTPKERLDAINTAALKIARRNGGDKPDKSESISYFDNLAMYLTDKNGAGIPTSKESITKAIDDGTIGGGDVLKEFISKHNINNMSDLAGAYANNSLELNNEYGIELKDQNSQRSRFDNLITDSEYGKSQTKALIEFENNYKESGVAQDKETGDLITNARVARAMNILDNPAAWAEQINNIDSAINNKRIKEGDDKKARQIKTDMLTDMGNAVAVQSQKETGGLGILGWYKTGLRAVMPGARLLIDEPQPKDVNYFDVMSKQIALQFDNNIVGSVDDKNALLAGYIAENVISTLKSRGFDFNDTKAPSMGVVREITEYMTNIAVKNNFGGNSDTYIDADGNVFFANTGKSQLAKDGEDIYYKNNLDVKEAAGVKYRVAYDGNGKVKYMELIK